MSTTKMNGLMGAVVSGNRLTGRNKVLEVLRWQQSGFYPGLTRAEIAVISGMKINVVCGRVNELLKAGQVKVNTVRQCRETLQRVQEITIVQQCKEQHHA